MGARVRACARFGRLQSCRAQSNAGGADGTSLAGSAGSRPAHNGAQRRHRYHTTRHDTRRQTRHRNANRPRLPGTHGKCNSAEPCLRAVSCRFWPRRRATLSPAPTPISTPPAHATPAAFAARALGPGQVSGAQALRRSGQTSARLDQLAGDDLHAACCVMRAARCRCRAQALAPPGAPGAARSMQRAASPPGADAAPPRAAHSDGLCSVRCLAAVPRVRPHTPARSPAACDSRACRGRRALVVCGLSGPGAPASSGGQRCTVRYGCGTVSARAGGPLPLYRRARGPG